RLEADDLRDLLLLDRRELDEAREARLSADADGHRAALHRVALGELGQRLDDEGLAVVAGVGEDGFVLDHVEVIDAERIPLTYELDGFESAVPDVDAPGKSGGGHVDLSVTPVGALRGAA